MEHPKEKKQGNCSLQDSVRQMYQHHLDTGDVTFQVGEDDDEVKAHKFILMCRSNVFFSMFAKHDPPKEALKLTDTKRDVFIQFLEFLYTDFTQVTAENFGDLMCCAKKYETEFLSVLCKTSLRNFISTNIVCQMMEFSQIYNDPEIVNICLGTVEHHMPSFLYTDLFLQLCPTCVYKITQYDRMLAPEKVIFERVLKWSEEECTRQKLSVTADNQRKILGDILYEIRFPIMDHQYLEDVVCGSKLLNDGEKVDILRQQLKSKKETPGKFKTHTRIWEPTAVMLSKCHIPKAKLHSFKAGCEYSLRFGVSSQTVLLGIYLNIESIYPYFFQVKNSNVIASITPLELLGGDTTDEVKDFPTPLSEVKENRIELYPRFFIPLKKGVQYTVCVHFDDKMSTSLLFKEMQQLPTPIAFNRKTLSVSTSSNVQLIRGLWMA